MTRQALKRCNDLSMLYFTLEIHLHLMDFLSYGKLISHVRFFSKGLISSCMACP